MKRRRLILAILFAFPVICSAASKEIVELQRDVAQLQDQVRTLQSAFDTKMTALTMTVQQSVDAANKANNAIVGLQGDIQEQMRQQGKEVVGPVANVGTKIDEMATAFQQVQNSMADVTARLGNLEQQMKDLSNAVRTMQTPPAPPPSTTGASSLGPTASAPPPSGTMLYTNANRDRLGGKLDLAMQEFSEYLKYYPDDALAPAAQFWIGNIYFTQGDYDNALKAFDLVLERFPANNTKAPDALYWKGKTLLKLGKRTAAATQFHEVVRKYSSSEAAANARLQLKQMGLSSSTSASRKR